MGRNITAKQRGIICAAVQMKSVFEQCLAKHIAACSLFKQAHYGTQMKFKAAQPVWIEGLSSACPCVESSAHRQRARGDDMACLSWSARRKCNQVRRHSTWLYQDLSSYGDCLFGSRHSDSLASQRAANWRRAES